jgi:hypothetical protein
VVDIYVTIPETTARRNTDKILNILGLFNKIISVQVLFFLECFVFTRLFFFLNSLDVEEIFKSRKERFLISSPALHWGFSDC